MRYLKFGQNRWLCAFNTFDIPFHLMINLDLTPLPYCLISSQYTMAWLKRVAIAGSPDHRQITGTFSIILLTFFVLPM